MTRFKSPWFWLNNLKSILCDSAYASCLLIWNRLTDAVSEDDCQPINLSGRAADWQEIQEPTATPANSCVTAWLQAVLLFVYYAYHGQPPIFRPAAKCRIKNHKKSGREGRSELPALWSPRCATRLRYLREALLSLLPLFFKHSSLLNSVLFCFFSDW